MAIKYRERISEFITTINTDKSYKVNDELLDVIQFNSYNTRRVKEMQAWEQHLKQKRKEL